MQTTFIELYAGKTKLLDADDGVGTPHVISSRTRYSEKRVKDFPEIKNSFSYQNMIYVSRIFKRIAQLWLEFGLLRWDFFKKKITCQLRQIGKYIYSTRLSRSLCSKNLEEDNCAQDGTLSLFLFFKAFLTQEGLCWRKLSQLDRNEYNCLPPPCCSGLLEMVATFHVGPSMCSFILPSLFCLTSFLLGLNTLAVLTSHKTKLESSGTFDAGEVSAAGYHQDTR